MVGRVAALREALVGSSVPRRILDFGCGTGETSAHLAATFPGATVVGVDSSREMVACARERHRSPSVSFAAPAELGSGESFDVCYVNGVLHHIEPPDRDGVLTRLYGLLRVGGRLALFENNPANPGTRWVMARIPFDRQAKVISSRQARRLLATVGFSLPARTEFLFVFPRWLRSLRRLEVPLRHLPLGAQYLVVGVKLEASMSRHALAESR